MRQTLLTLLLSASFFTAFSQLKDLSWQQAMELSAKENKLLLIVDEVPVCVSCKTAEAYIYRASGSDNILSQRFIAVRYEGLKNSIPDQRVFSPVPQQYPVFYVVNAKGELQHRISGYSDSALFMSGLQAALDTTRNLAYYRSLDKAGKLKKADEVMSYCLVLADGGVDTEPRAMEYLKAKSAPGKKLSGDNLKIAYTFISKIDNPYHAEARKQKDDLVKLGYAAKDINRNWSDDFQAYMKNASNILKHGPEFVSWADGILKEMKLEQDQYAYLLLLAKVRYLKTTGDTKAYMKSADSLLTHFEKQAQQDYALLNEVAYDFSRFAQTRSEMEKALQWSQMSFDAAPYSFNAETTAGIASKLGRKSKAIEYIDWAIQKAAENGDPLLEFYKLRKTEIMAASGE